MELSYSTLSSYFICPRRVELKEKGTKGPITVALAMGAVFHNAIHRAFTGEGDVHKSVQNGIEKLLSGEELSSHPFQKESNWNGEIIKLPKDPELTEVGDWLTDAVSVVLREMDGQVTSELPLKREIGGIKLVGVLDALWRGQIIDFKLVSSRSKGGSLMQAAFYAILTGGPAKMSYWLVRKRKQPMLEIQPIPEAEDEAFLSWAMEHTIEPTAQMIQTGIFPANPDHRFCSKGFCQFYASCKGKLKWKR